MHEIRINISDYLKHFLDRYYPWDKSIEERFYMALAEELIITRGKAFYLSLNGDLEYKKLIEEDRIAANSYSLDYDNHDIAI